MRFMGEGTPLTGRSVWWGCGRWCSWASLGFRFLVGMPSHFRSRLGSVWSAMVLTSEWTGLLSVYTRVCDAHACMHACVTRTHTQRCGIPSTTAPPSAWFPPGLWAGNPAPCKVGRQDAGLVPGGVCGWRWGRGLGKLL